MDKDSVQLICKCGLVHECHKSLETYRCDCDNVILTKDFQAKRVAYIVGAYRSDSHYGLLLNIDKARKASHELWKLGWATITPHLNSAFFSCPDIPEQNFLDGYLAIIERLNPETDVIIVLDNHIESQGSIAEIKHASEECGIKILTYEEVKDELDSSER